MKDQCLVHLMLLLSNLALWFRAGKVVKLCRVLAHGNLRQGDSREIEDSLENK